MPHPGSDLGLGDAEAAAHLGEPEGAWRVK